MVGDAYALFRSWACLEFREALLRGVLLSEDLSRKFFDPGIGGLPGARREPGFHTSLVEECLAVPSIFAGDLRQQETCETASADDQAVTSDFDLADVDHPFDRPHDGDFEVQQRHFFFSHRKK